MALKNKIDQLLNVSEGTNTGGAPFRAEDWIRIQDNAQADTANLLEFFRSKLPEYLYYQGSGQPYAKEHEAGLIVAGCEYDTTNPAAPVFSEGYILSGGEICYFPGGTYAAGDVLYLKKGTATNTQRVFKDGSSKDMLTIHPVDIEVSTVGAFSLNSPAGVSASDEIVILVTDSVSTYSTEKNHTITGATGLIQAAERLNSNNFLTVTGLATGVTVASQGLTFMASRVDGIYTEIVGGVEIDLSTFSAGLLFNLAAENLSQTAGVGVILDAKEQSSVLSGAGVEFSVSVQNSGAVNFSVTSGSLPASGIVTLQFNSRVIGALSAPSDLYEFNSNFLKIN
ncbi:hypothetical protein [uncultured Mediterranean phage uvMED]|nr:hypothetical protein [uncultured Mediterranean phage uvMED]BAR22582.1 hypothetical protein [uncultured Mediterranean phage uvMED]